MARPLVHWVVAAVLVALGCAVAVSVVAVTAQAEMQIVSYTYDGLAGSSTLAAIDYRRGPPSHAANARPHPAPELASVGPLVRASGRETSL